MSQTLSQTKAELQKCFFNKPDLFQEQFPGIEWILRPITRNGREIRANLIGATENDVYVFEVVNGELRFRDMLWSLRTARIIKDIAGDGVDFNPIPVVLFHGDPSEEMVRLADEVQVRLLPWRDYFELLTLRPPKPLDEVTPQPLSFAQAADLWVQDDAGEKLLVERKLDTECPHLKKRLLITVSGK